MVEQGLNTQKYLRKSRNATALNLNFWNLYAILTEILYAQAFGFCMFRTLDFRTGNLTFVLKKKNINSVSH